MRLWSGFPKLAPPGSSAPRSGARRKPSPSRSRRGNSTTHGPYGSRRARPTRRRRGRCLWLARRHRGTTRLCDMAARAKPVPIPPSGVSRRRRSRAEDDGPGGARVRRVPSAREPSPKLGTEWGFEGGSGATPRQPAVLYGGLPMGWTPPPGGIAMCHDGTEAIATLRGLTITGRRHPHGRG